MAVRINRIDRKERANWVPLKTPRGYQLVKPGLPKAERNLNRNATFVTKLEHAIDLIERGYSIRMAPPGASRGNYISPKSLKISR